MSGMNLKELYENVAEKWGKKSAENLAAFIELKNKTEMENRIDTLATKEDLYKVEHRLELKISELKIEFKTEMGKMKVDLIKWVITLWIAQAVMMFALK